MPNALNRILALIALTLFALPSPAKAWTGPIATVQSIGIYLPITSLTQSAGTATGKVSSTANLTTGEMLDVYNVSTPGYSGRVQINVVDGTTITWPVASTTFSPATGQPYLIAGFAVTTLTSSGTTATGTIANTGGLVTGQSLTIINATQTGYDITTPITVTSGTQFTFAVSSGLTTPATGTITALPVPTPIFNSSTTAADRPLRDLSFIADATNDCVTWISGLTTNGPGYLPHLASVDFQLSGNGITSVSASCLSATSTAVLKEHPTGKE